MIEISIEAFALMPPEIQELARTMEGVVILTEPTPVDWTDGWVPVSFDPKKPFYVPPKADGRKN